VNNEIHEAANTLHSAPALGFVCFRRRRAVDGCFIGASLFRLITWPFSHEDDRRSGLAGAFDDLGVTQWD
jgi:hypothetical protein